jgi:diguanylate cyclase (GGDEF)-like protein
MCYAEYGKLWRFIVNLPGRGFAGPRICRKGGPPVYEALVLEINALCGLILLYVLYRMRSSIDRQESVVAFVWVILSVLAALALDSIRMLTDGVLLRIWYPVQTAAVGCGWLEFVEVKLKKHRDVRPARRFARLAPLCALAALSVTSPWTGLIFQTDGNGASAGGPLAGAPAVVACGYLALSLTEVVREARQTAFYRRAAEARTLLSFFILPGVGGLLGLWVKGLPGIWPFTTLSLLMVYIRFQDYQISTDGLTGLNNRRQFDSRLRALTEELHSPDRLYLLLMDVNAFKRINDTYGHYEGDRALFETASVLKRACRGENLFLARYGGDEFAMLLACAEKEKPQEIKDRIGQLFRERNETTASPYAITLSIGVGEYLPGRPRAIPALIAGADRALYKEKERIKSAERSG